MAFGLAGWLGAVSALAVYHALFTFIVIAVPKRATYARFASILPLSAAAYAVIIHTIGPIGPLQLNTTLLVIFLVHWLSLIEYICMAQLDSFKLSELVLRDEASNTKGKPTKTENNNRITSASGTATIGQQVWKALSLTTNFRRLYTEWEVKNVFYQETKQTRLGFVIDVLPKATLSYLIIDCLMHAPPPPAHLITEAKQTPWRLWTLTSEDFALRLPGLIVFWLVARLVIYIITQGVLGVPSVTLGLSSPDYWQPLFGPFSEFYTIRGFWG
ncbi:hypothetical protein NQ176_g735 [Zarea fungicola]|uniref:Uncharacterized protein n=1 Tax=Zarea fungicola TaxID=93591 RepID=A0ACC1NX65_9HYPO|nr:hypothetical protein NQ176_g735 [Lecanicillium fungicola]